MTRDFETATNVKGECEYNISCAKEGGKRKEVREEGPKEGSCELQRGHDGDRRRRKKKRRREKVHDGGVGGEAVALSSSSSGSTEANNTLSRKKPLNGLTVAVSTLEVRGSRHTSDSDSYKHVTSECVTAGASVTGQVHKRVFAVICNRSAIGKLTQRVRKALKRNILLLDASWVRECVERGERVDHRSFALNELAEEAMRNKGSCVAERAIDGDESRNIILENDEATQDISKFAGWTEPKDLDCCCVCHENGNLDCEWCTGCNVTLARRNSEDAPTKKRRKKKRGKSK